jgi:hypothetical protein
MRLRSFAPIAALFFATATTAATVDAADSTAKPASKEIAKGKPAKPDHGAKKKIAALIDKHHKSLKKLPQLPAASPGAKPEAAKPSKKEAKAEAKKAEAKKEEAKKEQKASKDEPPPELTGSLPQSKIADKKKSDAAAKKVEKTEAKSKDEKKSDAAKKESKKDEKRTDAPAKKADANSKEGGGVAAKEKKSTALGKKAKGEKCLSTPVSFTRSDGSPETAFPLTTCDGKVAAGAIGHLSVLARPYTVKAPKVIPASTLKPGKKDSTKFELAPGIGRVNDGIPLRLQAIATRFPGRTITVVSGYRPASTGSLHAKASAFDIRVEGVTNETLVAFCKTLKDTGCGYYPNSFFVHVDVRPAGTGHVYWIDTSGPGEKPNYVKSWPPPLPPLPTSKNDEAKASSKDATKVETKDTLIDSKPKDILPTTDEKTIGADEDGTHD